ncbi:MAG: hypothetical protein JW955_11970 [Sedimentisphaerales bacterium]|nr:hypothetical protein [Sedimentisphaerales bacterium]
MNRVSVITIRSVLILSALAVRTALAQDYAIDWHTIDGGGAGPANASAGGNYTLSGTIGQPDARNHPQPMTGGSYRLTGGFWVIPECPAIPADYDGDCDVDQADYQTFESCASGPGYVYGSGCDDRDFDTDADVDQSDFAVFQRCLSGPDVPADPNCAD